MSGFSSAQSLMFRFCSSFSVSSSLPSHRNISYEDLLGALQRFGSCQQRLGQWCAAQQVETVPGDPSFIIPSQLEQEDQPVSHHQLIEENSFRTFELWHFSVTWQFDRRGLKLVSNPQTPVILQNQSWAELEVNRTIGRATDLWWIKCKYEKYLMTVSLYITSVFCYSWCFHLLDSLKCEIKKTLNVVFKYQKQKVFTF